MKKSACSFAPCRSPDQCKTENPQINTANSATGCSRSAAYRIARLARDWDYKSVRTETDEAYGRMFKNTTEEADKRVVGRAAEVAKARGLPRARIALAWLLHKPVITAPIVGATKLEHLDDALGSLEVKLSAEEIAELEEPCAPHGLAGFA
jgi:aryl-alcohol dehydrogenase-like predicted oxidoreductase